jgi:hypothetical protein
LQIADGRLQSGWVIALNVREILKYPLKNWGWFCHSEFSVPCDKRSGQVLLNEKSQDYHGGKFLRFVQNVSIALFRPCFLNGYKKFYSRIILL